MESLHNLCPIAGWALGPIKALDSIAIRLDFLPRSTLQLADTGDSPRYVLTVGQAEDLADSIARAVQVLKLAESSNKKSEDLYLPPSLIGAVVTANS